MTTLGTDIGGTKFSIAAFQAGHFIRRESRSTDKQDGRDWMLCQFAAMTRAWRADLTFDNCGVGFGGPVNFAAQRVALSTHVGGWRDFPLTAHLGNELGIRVIMDNDANVGAIGEATHGAGQGADPLFYMTLSTGIGGGIDKAGDLLFAPLRVELRRQITGWSAARIEVAPTALGDDSVLYERWD